MFCRAKKSQAPMLRDLLLPIPQRRGKEESGCDKHICFSPSVPPDCLSFCLGDVQKGNNITLAPSNSSSVLPLAVLEKDFISNVVNIQHWFCSH